MQVATLLGKFPHEVEAGCTLDEVHEILGYFAYKEGISWPGQKLNTE